MRNVTRFVYLSRTPYQIEIVVIYHGNILSFDIFIAIANNTGR